MQEVTIKKDNKIVLNDEIIDFLNPKFLFIPIKEGFEVKVKEKTYVYKNDIVAINKNGEMLYTGVSGQVLGAKTVDYPNKARVKSLVIENDFKENIRVRKSSRRYLNELQKKDIMNILSDTTLFHKNHNVLDILSLQSDTLLINGVEFEPYFYKLYSLLKREIDEILDTIDLIATLVGAKKVLLVIKNTDNDLIKNLMDSLGTYPNITLKLVNDAVPNGHIEVLKRKFDVPGALAIDVEEVKKIYDVLKREVPITEKLITITGNAVRPCSVVRVKLGCLLSEVFVNNFDFTAPNIDVYLNGMIKGRLTPTLNIVVDDDLDGILVMEKTKRVEEKCLNCGLCSKSCPMGLNPKYVFDHAGNVRSEYYETCIQCGVCNYVCPANRDLSSFMKRGE